MGPASQALGKVPTLFGFSQHLQRRLDSFAMGPASRALGQVPTLFGFSQHLKAFGSFATGPASRALGKLTTRVFDSTTKTLKNGFTRRMVFSKHLHSGSSVFAMLHNRGPASRALGEVPILFSALERHLKTALGKSAMFVSTCIVGMLL